MDGGNGTTTPMEMKEMVTTASTEEPPGTPAVGEMTGLTEHLRNEQRQYNLRHAPRLPHYGYPHPRGGHARTRQSPELSPRSNRYLSRYLRSIVVIK